MYYSYFILLFVIDKLCITKTKTIAMTDKNCATILSTALIILSYHFKPIIKIFFIIILAFSGWLLHQLLIATCYLIHKLIKLFFFKQLENKMCNHTSWANILHDLHFKSMLTYLPSSEDASTSNRKRFLYK